MKIQRRSLVAAIIAGLSVLVLASCEVKKKPLPPQVAYVRVEVAERAPDVVRASGTGEIMARIDSDLSFKVPGKVISRSVGVGDKVKAGQILATIDPIEQRADIESASASVAAKEATLRMASPALNRRKVLASTGAVSQQELDRALQEYQSAENDLSGARAMLGTAKDALLQTELRAVSDGTITVRNVEVGQVVQPLTTVFTLANDGDLDAVFNVEESALSGGASPLSIEVALISRPDVTAIAKVREISPTLDRSLGTVRVKLAIENPPEEMTLGSAITADVVVEKVDRISVPWQSLFSKAGIPAVWIVDPATLTVSIKPVEIERFDARKVVLLSGVNPEDLVVVAGGQFLREKQKVSISKKASQ